MKKTILAIMAILIVAMFVVAGCGGSTTAPDDKSAPIKKEIANSQPVPQQEVKAAEPEPEVVAEPEAEPEPVRTMSKKVAELLEKHSKVKSMTYMYQDLLNYPMEWPTWVKGDKVAIDIRDLEEIKTDVYISKVYLNTATQTAEGYCESKIMRCNDPNQAFDVTYRKYKRKTPLDWIKEVKYAEKEGEETKQQRLVVKLVYEDDGDQVTMWVDDYYGVPMEVWVKSGSNTKKYIYEDLAINSVDDSDLEHQMISKTYSE